MSDPMRRTITVRRREAGGYVNGRWVEGDAIDPFDMRASVQPVDSQTAASLPEGRRAEGSIELITDEELIAKRDDGTGDIVAVDGREYEVFRVIDWSNGVIPHYESLAERVSH